MVNASSRPEAPPPEQRMATLEQRMATPGQQHSLRLDLHDLNGLGQDQTAIDPLLGNEADHAITGE